MSTLNRNYWNDNNLSTMADKIISNNNENLRMDAFIFANVVAEGWDYISNESRLNVISILSNYLFREDDEYISSLVREFSENIQIKEADEEPIDDTFNLFCYETIDD